MKLKVLGGLSGQTSDVPGEPLAPSLNSWVAAVLASSEGPISREELATLLWPELSGNASANALRQRLHRLRQSPLNAGLGSEPRTLSWTGGSDVAEFRRACAAQDWDAALALYTGPLLLNVPLTHPPLADWLEGARAELHEQYLHALWQHLPALLKSSQQAEAAQLLRRASRFTPDNSDLVAAHARTLLSLRDPAQARHLIGAHQAHLKRELGEELSSELTMLLAEAATQSTAQATAQVAAQAAPPLRPPEVWGLPVVLTSFVGRTQEMSSLLSALSGSDASRRWLTLTGPGGIGKTRLACELARRFVAQTGQSAYFCSLAPLSSGPQITELMLHALGEAPEGEQAPLRRLTQALNHRQVLIVLDNFEHLLGAADLLPELLAACPGVRLLVTSRQRLKFQAETVMRLGSLSGGSPDGGSPSGNDLGAAAGAVSSPPTNRPQTDPAPENIAAQLFIDRASRADASFSPRGAARVIAQIALRCEGVPLAIELAAAWAAEYSPHDILEHLEQGWDFLQTDLRDVPGRHRSLRAVFEYAWQALPPRLREVYARLSVFRSPFGLQAAARVAAASPADLRLLEQRSLLNSAGAQHFTWHESLRDYALEQLGEELPARLDLHLAYYLALAEDTAPRLKSPQQAHYFGELAAVYADLRSALGHALRVHRTESGLRLAGALHWFWYVRGFREEGLRWLELFLEQAEGHSLEQEALERSPARALALRAAGSLASDRDLPEQAARRYAQALELYRQLGDLDGEAYTHHVQGVLSRNLGEYPQAGASFARALALREQLGDPLGMATTLNDLGILAAYQDDPHTARQHFGRSLELKREVGDVQGVAYALNNLANVTDDQEEILSLQAESLRLKQELGDLEGCAVSYVNQGATLKQLGRLVEAAQELGRGLGLFVKLGKLARVAPVLGMVAELANRAGQPLTALEFAAAALDAEHKTGVRMMRSEREDAETQMAKARAALRPGEREPMVFSDLLSSVNAALAFLALEFGAGTFGADTFSTNTFGADGLGASSVGTDTSSADAHGSPQR